MYYDIVMIFTEKRDQELRQYNVLYIKKFKEALENTVEFLGVTHATLGKFAKAHIYK